MLDAAHPHTSLWRRLAICCRMVKPAHAVFVLPPALCGVIFATSGLPDLRALFWMLMAMLGIWCASMAYNRIADRAQDALNPRTAHRVLPRGEITLSTARWFCAASAALFLISAAMLGSLCFVLAFPALGLALAYSHIKYHSWLCHFAIGAVTGITPTASWLAFKPEFALGPAVLGLGLLFWVAGFDMIYACQDAEFDREHGFRSAPADFGESAALILAAGCHVNTVIFFVLAGIIQGLGFAYFLSIVFIAGLLYQENRLVSTRDLSRVGTAFLTCNALVAVVLFLGVLCG